MDALRRTALRCRLYEEDAEEESPGELRLERWTPPMCSSGGGGDTEVDMPSGNWFTWMVAGGEDEFLTGGRGGVDIGPAVAAEGGETEEDGVGEDEDEDEGKEGCRGGLHASAAAASPRLFLWLLA